MHPITIGCVRLPGATSLRKEAFLSLVQHYPDAHLLLGVNDETELAFASYVMQLRKAYPLLRVTGVLACETRTNDWREDARDRFFAVMDHRDEECLLQTHETPDCLSKKDRCLATRADLLFLYAAKS